VHKGSTQTNKRTKLGFKRKEQKKPKRTLVWRTGCLVCHRTVSGAPGSIDFKLFTFGFLRPRSAIIHRTVRCATGLSGAPAEQWLQRNGRLQWTPAKVLLCADSSRRVRADARRRTGQWTGPVRCGTELSGATRRQISNSRNCQNPNGWVTWLAHRTLSGAPIDSSQPQRLNWWLEAINNPQPPPLQPSKHSQQCIQYKSNTLHSKDTIQVIDLLKVPNPTLAH
jgi:hypothetical protein